MTPMYLLNHDEEVVWEEDQSYEAYSAGGDRRPSNTTQTDGGAMIYR
jgi:hypothetical protein